MATPGRLDRFTCLVVGGTGGIGQAVAERFLDEGARVVVSGLEAEGVDQAVRRLAGEGDLAALQANVQDAKQVERLFEQAVERLGGRLDALVHVTGISGRRFGDGPLDACTADGWDAVMDVNARGAFLTNRAAVRQMLKQSEDPIRGAVVNIGSVLSRAPAPRHFGTVAYAASKGALEALTRTCAARYAQERIRFNLVAPGLVETPMARRALADPVILDYVAARQPLARGPVQPIDVAEAALFLVEPGARFITGAILDVDAGWALSEGRNTDINS